MKYHIDRRVILNQETEFKNLYEWSLQELDADGNKVGRDQVPWVWGLYFKASELALCDTIAFEPDKTAVRERQFIEARLHPGHPRDQEGYREPRYSMFGTDRTISTFQLRIEKLEDGKEHERCIVDGIVSYTAEIDFYDETTDDCIVFNLYVRPETFARYAEKIAASAVDGVVFHVSRVAGFYSDWSPRISTDEIKVLTSYEEHKLEIPDDCAINPPRLGKVVIPAELSFHSISKLDKAKPETNEEAEGIDEEADGIDEEEIREESDKEEITKEPNDDAGRIEPIQRLAAGDDRTVKLLSSLRIAAWIIAGLLLLILTT